MLVPRSRRTLEGATAEDKLGLVWVALLVLVIYLLTTGIADFVVPCILGTLLSLDLYKTFLQDRHGQKR